MLHTSTREFCHEIGFCTRYFGFCVFFTFNYVRSRPNRTAAAQKSPFIAEVFYFVLGRTFVFAVDISPCPVLIAIVSTFFVYNLRTSLNF
jgi:hypothetical protein